MIEVRDNGRFWALSGFATTYNRAYFVGHGARDTFKETIMPGAFTSATRSSAHIELRVEHDATGPVLASTSGRTMSLADDIAGLTLGAALAKRSADAVRAVKQIKAGTLRSFSVAMHVDQDRWPASNVRHVIAATLFEVSLVRNPCNPEAVVTAIRHERRSADPQLEYRAIPLVYRDAPFGVDDVEEWDDDDGDEIPPNLRLAAVGSDRRCATCFYFDSSRHTCTMFDDYSVEPEQVCDAWEGVGQRAAADAHAIDRARTPAHLVDTVLGHLRHLHRHLERLSDPDVKSSAKATAFNLDHAVNHHQEATDHLLKLDKHLSAHSSEPGVYQQERLVLGENRRYYSGKQREAMAREGLALADGSFPIRDRTDLAAAIKAIGRAKNYQVAKKHIIKRARALNAMSMLPDDWNMKRAADIDDVRDALERSKWLTKLRG